MSRRRSMIALLALSAWAAGAGAAHAGALQPPVRSEPMTIFAEPWVNAMVGPYGVGTWSDGNGSTTAGNDDAGITVHNSYLRCDTHGDACSTIAGATAWSYTLTPDDEGHTIRVRQYASNAAGDSAAELSDPTAVVQYAVPTPEGPLGLFGDAIVGHKIGAYNGGWVGSTMFYESYSRCDATGASCIEIPGATGWTYTLTDDDLGHTIRVSEYATNAKGSSVVQTTVPSDVVVSDPDASAVTPPPVGVATPTPPSTPTPVDVVTPTPVVAVTVPLVVAAPTPAPAAPPVAVPATNPAPPAALLAGKVALAALPVAVKPGSACPKRVNVTVKAGKTTMVRRLATSTVAGQCLVTSSVTLSGKLAHAASVNLTVAGPGVKTTRRTVRRG